jgi:hypothetical protein
MLIHIYKVFSTDNLSHFYGNFSVVYYLWVALLWLQINHADEKNCIRYNFSFIVFIPG